MDVLFVTAEATPFAKVGGLGDVVGAGSLPAALRRLEVDARVMMPMYGTIDRAKHDIRYDFSFTFTRPTGTAEVHVHSTETNGVPFYFIEGWPYFGEEHSVYTEWNWDVPRFIFFNQVAMAAAYELKKRYDWFPQLFHVHDWHTGLIPFLIRESADDKLWQDVKSMVTIHNMAHQGNHVGGWLWELGVAGRHHPELVSRGLTDNMLAISLAYADYLTTVSPRHADEIQYPYMGYGLDGLVRARVMDMYGVLNGIDVDQYNPETDRYIARNFNADNFQTQRIINKRTLQSNTGLPVRDDVPLIGVVSRIVWQKGFDLLIPAIRQLLAEEDVQFIALGTGAPDLTQQFWQVGNEFPTKARTFIRYDAAVAQKIYAGCDLFVMPSHYEPCGIGQMIAMRYGALPLVRETGGLADTVTNYDNGPGNEGTGFVFDWEESDAVLNTLRWAVNTYRHHPEAWQQMQQNAMTRDFSWDRSATTYVSLYHHVLAHKRA